QRARRSGAISIQRGDDLPDAGEEVSADATQAARFLLDAVRARYGARALQGPRRPPIACASSVAEIRLIATTRLCRVPELAVRALVGWADGQRPALLLDALPSPRALLSAMAHGER